MTEHMNFDVRDEDLLFIEVAQLVTKDLTFYLENENLKLQS